MKNTWKSLVNIALLGTDRGKLSESVVEELRGNGIETESSPTATLLQAAAFYAPFQKIALPQTERTGGLPPSAPNVERKICSPNSCQHWGLILNGTYEMAMQEFLVEMANQELYLPDETIPDVLEKCKTKKELVHIVEPVLGAKGLWLASLNSRWKMLFRKPNQSEWAVAGKKKRLKILELVRQSNPTEAITLLQSTWDTESITDKATFLKKLNINLSKSDEPFLENLLNSSRKEIRKPAAQLLAKIEGSGLITRMCERVEKYITVKTRSFKKEKLELNPPDELDSSMIRDDIDPRSQWFRGGLKVGRIGQMIAMIPPKWWEAYFGKSAREVLQIFVRTDDYAELLIQAVMEATALHQDENWMDVLLSFWLDSKGKQRWTQLKVNPLLENLTKPVFNKIAANGLEGIGGLLEETDPITTLLKSNPHQWNNRLTILFIENLKNWLAMESSRYWNGWHYRGILKKAAYQCNPNLYTQLSKDWPIDSRIWSSWEKEIQQFLNILQFRKMMIIELRK